MIGNRLVLGSSSFSYPEQEFTTFVQHIDLGQKPHSCRVSNTNTNCYVCDPLARLLPQMTDTHQPSAQPWGRLWVVVQIGSPLPLFCLLQEYFPLHCPRSYEAVDR